MSYFQSPNIDFVLVTLVSSSHKLYILMCIGPEYSQHIELDLKNKVNVSKLRAALILHTVLPLKPKYIAFVANFQPSQETVCF